MNTPTIEIAGNVPAHPSFILPSGVNLAVVKELERILGGKERVVWMVENALPPAPELMQYLQQNHCAGFFTAMAQSGSEPVVQRIGQILQTGCHVVFLCGSSAADAATDHEEIPASALSFADGSSLAVVPLAVQMVGSAIADGLFSPQACSHLRLHFMPEQTAGAAMGLRVKNAWQQASAEALAHFPAVEQASLPHALLKSMLRHQEAVMIDGVDDSQITYRRVLACAMLLSRRLRRYTSGKRLGVILPPGKRAVIANLACLFAGIVPVNVDYTATEQEFAHVCAAAHIDRFISSERFLHKQEKFCWPNRRDIIFIDKELHAFGRFRLRLCEWMLKTCGKSFIVSRLKLKRPEPMAEALFAFIPGSGKEPARAMAHSHRAVMAAVLQWQQALHLKKENAALFSQPLYRADAVVPGLILPLLLGQKIVMYPTPVAGVRLCDLIKNYRVAHAVFCADEARGVFQPASREHLAALQYLVVPGMPAVPDVVQEAVHRFGITVKEYHGVPEFAAPLSINTYSAAPQTPAVAAKPAEVTRVIGRLLPGIAVRVSDFAAPTRTVAPNAVGVVHLSGPAMASPAGQAGCAAGDCYTPAAAGCVDIEGNLTLLGPTERYSRVNGELISHAEAESVVLEALEAKMLPGMERRVAIVALPGPGGGADTLVLLSTIHRQVFSHDVSTLQHKIKRLHYSANWAPRHIIPVQSIPTLPDGTLNYDYCRRGIRRFLGMPEPSA